METQLNSSGMSSQDLRLWRFFKKSRMICKDGTLNLRISKIGSFSCLCSTILIGQEKATICVPSSKKIQGISQGHQKFLGLGDEKKRYGTLSYTPEGKMGLHSQSDGEAIQRNMSSSIQEYWCFVSRNSEQERITQTPYTSMRMLRTLNSCSESFTM